jgi:wyosine [tRNA(Phe)-imidazoG37] synthetase (radical SAM superfamily)
MEQSESSHGLRRVSPREEIVYGPVRSRRLGHSLGINVNPRKGKTCSFDCVYCQYGKTMNYVTSSVELSDWLPEDTILKEIEQWLQRLVSEDRPLDSITFSGYGESTLHPRLREIIQGVKKLRDEYYHKAKINILTNSSTVADERVFEALMDLDSVVAKLDAGDQESFEAINRPVMGTTSLDEIVQGLARLQDEYGGVIIQTLIFKSTSKYFPDNTSLDEIDHLTEKVGFINPVEIQVYTVARQPSEAFIEPVDNSLLRETTRRINQFLGRECAKMYV